MLAAHAHVLVGRHLVAKDTTARRRSAPLAERADLLSVLVVVLGRLQGEEPRGLVAHRRERAPDPRGGGPRFLRVTEDLLEAQAPRSVDHLLADAVPVPVRRAVERVGEGAAHRLELIGGPSRPAAAMMDEVLDGPPRDDALHGA